MTTVNSRADALTEQQIEAVIAKATGKYRAGDSYTFEDVWNCIETALAASPASQPAAAPIHPDVLAHIKWLHYCLREAGHCIDGGTCHHECESKGECWRQDGCVPLTGSRLTDDWEIPAPSPADERAAFEAALDKRAKSAGFEVGRMTECELDNAWWGWQAARAASANETGAEGALGEALSRARSALYAIAKTYDDGELRVRALEAYEQANDVPTQAPAQAAMPALTNAMRAVITNESGAYQSADDLYAALCAAADDERPAQADARVRLTADERNALNEAVKQLPSISAMRTLRDKILAAHQDQPEPRALLARGAA